MLRSLSHFWRRHLAVVLAAAVTGAVLTGSLVVGGSVRASLRALLLERLGKIDLVTVAPHFFRADLASEATRRAGGGPIVPIVLLRGSAARADVAAGGDRAATPVQILGIDERFAGLYPRPEPALLALSARRGLFPPLVVNETLARALGAAPGDDVLLYAEQPSAVPREALMGYKDSGSVVANLRLTLVGVVPDRAAGSFDLALGQGTPANAFVPLAELQRALGQEGRANTLLFAGPRPGGATGTEPALRASLDLEDLSLTLRPVPAGAPEVLVLDSRDFFLSPAVAQAAAAAAGELGTPLQRVFTYLAIGLSAHGREVPYSLISALDPVTPVAPAPGETLRPLEGTTAPGDGEVLLDSWAAEDLAVHPGDSVEVRYFLPASGNAGPVLQTASSTLRVKGVVALAGLAIDRTLTPAVAGIAEARDIASWSAPFPVDLHRVRPKDEDYWHRYGPAPKAFVSLATGQRLWRGPFGDLTSLRIAVPAGPEGSAAAFARRFRARLLAHLPFAAFGFQPRAIRAEGLRAADLGTDFTSLFISFSSFLILASAALAGLLFALGLERRAEEIGLLLALGFPLRSVRRRFLTEGLVLATAGAVLGLVGAWAYAALQLYALGRWWLPAVGTSRLHLALQPSALLAGFAATVGVVLLSLLSGVRRIVRVPVARLLAGAVERGGPPRQREGRRLRLFAAGAALSTLFCGALLAAGSFGGHPHPALAFGLGVSLLLVGGSGFILWCRSSGERQSPHGGLVALALRNATVNPRRSVLALSLVASACFVLVMVAANRREAPAGKLPDWAGFTLLAESQVPLYQDLGSTAGRVELGFPEDAEALFSATEIVGLREVPGDDASCLNLYLPHRPRLLGVPPLLARRAGFRFAATVDAAARPLTLLEAYGENGDVPAIGDEQAVRWILHLGLGEELALGTLRLRIVGLLSGSPLQGALLVSDARLARAFPGHGGRSVFLLRPPPGQEKEVARVLRGTLGSFGLKVTTVGARMALYREVENTYLAIFQALGGLGLMLGTLGLGVVFLASIVERRWELATLRAFGFRRRRLAVLLLLENGALLALGLALGTVAGLLAAALGGGEQGPFPWLSLLPTLAGVALAGLAACTLAVERAMRSPLIAVLKTER